MKWLKEKLRGGGTAFGCWLHSGSSIVAEAIGGVGFDWLLIDCEHGPSDYDTLLRQLQGCNGSSAAVIVRVAGNDEVGIQRGLDLGAAGIMVPNVNSAEEAQDIVQAMRYPPEGRRGVSRAVRAGGYGREFADYFAKANKEVLTVVQIETVEALEDVDAIAGVAGVDVLFVGPSDLSVNLGVPFDLESAKFREAYEKVLMACKENGKTAGILLKKQADIKKAVRAGFGFVGIGSDLGFVCSAAKAALEGTRGR